MCCGDALRRSTRALPADPAVLASEALAVGKTHEIHDDLVLAASRDELAHDGRCPQADDEHFGLVDHRPRLGAHERADVRQGLVDVTAGGAAEGRPASLAGIDTNLSPPPVTKHGLAAQ